MTAKVAPLEIDDLASEVGRLIDGNSNEPRRLAQIQVRTNRLMNTGGAPRALALNVLLLTAFGLNQQDEVRRVVDEVLKEQWIHQGILMNASRVLVSIGDIDKANEVTDLMVSRHPDLKSLLAAAALNSEMILQLNKSMELISLHDKLAVNEDSKIDEKHRGLLSTSIKLSGEQNLTDADLMARLGEAIRAIRAHGGNILRMNRLVLRDGSFVSQLFVDADSGTCADLNFAVIDALVDQFDDPGASVFSITCRPFADFHDSQDVHYP